MAITFHHASFQVFAEGDGLCRLVWITDFIPNELKTQVQARVDRGAIVMKQTLESKNICIESDSQLSSKIQLDKPKPAV